MPKSESSLGEMARLLREINGKMDRILEGVTLSLSAPIFVSAPTFGNGKAERLIEVLEERLLQALRRVTFHEPGGPTDAR